MPANIGEESIWAAEVAARLRLLQFDAAGASPIRRREFLDEVIESALRDVAVARRNSFLNALSQRFPAWNAGTPAPPEPVPEAAPELTLEEMADEVTSRLGELSTEKKAALGRKLAEAGVAMPAPAASPFPSDEIGKKVQTALGLAAVPNSDRLASLFAMMLDTMEKLDQAACRTLEGLPVRSTQLKELRFEDFQEALRNYLAEAGEASADKVRPIQKLLDSHRRAMVALMASHVGLKGVSGVGREFDRWFREQFEPQYIEDVARPGNPIFFGERCWKKFAQRFKDELATPEHTDKKVREAAVTSVERIYLLRN